jgi:hypothetical protein
MFTPIFNIFLAIDIEIGIRIYNNFLHKSINFFFKSFPTNSITTIFNIFIEVAILLVIDTQALFACESSDCRLKTAPEISK